jgi:hypothetical protein
MKPLRTLRNVCDGKCRFIVGEPNGLDTLFCGEATSSPRKSYCPMHSKIVYLPAADKAKPEPVARWSRWTDPEPNDDDSVSETQAIAKDLFRSR